MAKNWIGGTHHYSCDICFDAATVLDSDHGHFCQRCADSYDFDSAEFLELLDRIDNYC
ncbi:hypothetical protein [Nocardia abscessus]|uniref:hypothetical protein n=1 Tax=Nocardia abscessus TaxID=120957 RepID=UPI002453EEB2|nr:hypothetical protein [Nocardia abscessus]